MLKNLLLGFSILDFFGRSLSVIATRSTALIKYYSTMKRTFGRTIASISQ